MSDIGQQIIAKIREHAAADPNFVYVLPGDSPACLYVHEGAPSCIVGQALWDLKLIDASIELDTTEIPDDIYESRPNTAGSATLLEHLGIGVDSDESRWIREVQRVQDNENTWGTAIEFADRRTPVPA